MHENIHYDIFVSYAYSDDENQCWMQKLTKMMERCYRSRTGRKLEYFLDKNRIITGRIWEESISQALHKSRVMVAILSPSYFTSEWCGQEWDRFSALEKEQRLVLHLPPDQGLIFPVRRIDWRTILRPSREESQRIDEANSRQYHDFENLLPGASIFEQKVEELIEHIIEVLRRIDQPSQSVLQAPDHQTQPITIQYPIEAHPFINIGTN